jgi:hypothetical protein
MSARGDVVFATPVTFVSPRSTYTTNVSKQSGMFDTFVDRVDRLDTSAGHVDILWKYRHEPETRRLYRHVAEICRFF